MSKDVNAAIELNTPSSLSTAGVRAISGAKTAFSRTPSLCI